MPTIVTQLVVDASGSRGGVADFEAAMSRAKAAAVEGGQATASSFERAQARWVQSLQSTDPVIKAQIAMERDLTRQRELNAKAVSLGIASEEAAAAQLDRVRAKHEAYIATLTRSAAANDNVAASAGAAAAAQQRALAQLGNSSTAVNARLGVRDDFASADRSSDIVAYGRELDTLRAKYNPLFAAGQQYKATLLEINQAARAGALTEQERVTAINATKAAFASQVGAINAAGNAYTAVRGKAVGLNGSLANLSFQLNDIVSGLLMGQSPFQIMAQQGGQVFQIWQMNRNIFGEVANAIGRVGSAIAAIVGIPGLLAIGFTAAAAGAYALYRYINSDGKTSESILKEHDRLLKVVKDSYDQVTKSAKNWFEQSKAVTQLQLLQQQIDLQKKLNEAVGKGIAATSYKITSGDIASIEAGIAQPVKDVADKFEPFSDAIAKLRKGFQDGTPNVREFMDEVARIALLKPALQTAGLELLNSVGDASKFARALDQVKQMLDLVNKGKLSKDNDLGIHVGPATNAYDDLLQRTRDRVDELKEEAKYAGQTGDAVLRLKLQHDADRAAKKAGVQVNQDYLDGLKDELATANRLNELAKIRADIDFDRKTAFLPQGEAAIAQQLRPVYGNNVTEALNSADAAAIRFNNTLRETSDVTRDAFKGFAQDILAGKSGLEALHNALGKISQKLMDMAFDNLWANAFGGTSKTGLNFFSLFGGGGSSSGPSMVVGGAGSMAVPTFHDGGIAGYKAATRIVHSEHFANAVRYHGGGIAGLQPDEVPAILRRGEPVFRSMEHARAAVGAANDNRPVQMTMKLQVVVTGNGDKQLKDEMKAGAERVVNQAFEAYRRYGVKEDIKSYQQDQRAVG